MRLCLLIALLLPGQAVAADRLPDMRWIFERAARLDVRNDVHRFDRVRAWALVPLLYPDDEPGTENDEVWRLVARNALTRLDASAAGYPPPLPPLPLHLPAPDPVGELLGAEFEADALGGVRVRAATAGSGLAVGDRILGCDGFTVLDPGEAAQRIADAGPRGRLRLSLAGGGEVELLVGRERPSPQLAALRVHGDLQTWEPPRRWRLPALDGLWLLTGTGAVEVDGRSPRAPPEAPAWTALAAGGTAIVAHGAHDLRATPLRGAWRPASERLILGLRAGQALVVETEGPAHLLSVSGPGGDQWSEPAVATAHRLARHGPAGVLASDAIERNGMAVISVRPMDGVRLRILTETDAGDPRP